MTAVGCLLIWLGLMLCLVGEVMFLAIVFRYSLVWFFGCLFVPFADLVYFLLNIRQTWKPVLLSTAGCLVAGIGCWLGGSRFPP